MVHIFAFPESLTCCGFACPFTWPPGPFTCPARELACPAEWATCSSCVDVSPPSSLSAWSRFPLLDPPARHLCSASSFSPFLLNSCGTYKRPSDVLLPPVWVCMSCVFCRTTKRMMIERRAISARKWMS